MILQPDTPCVQIGLSAEPVSALASLPSYAVREGEAALNSAKAIAADLYTFMASFAHSTARHNGLPNDVLVIPTDCIDRWYKNFEQKHRTKPFFWIKNRTE